ncbi:MAG: phosphotransferase [Candidatus Omnitrophica bacterium]|nr:phosphotransferase [Candidatus Omnitrophota bacterium]
MGVENGFRLSFLTRNPQGGRVLDASSLNGTGASGAWPFPDKSFDGVVVPDASLASQGSSPKFLAEAARVLKSDGWLFVTVPNRWGYNHLVRANGMRHAVSRKKVRRALEQAGFSGVREYALHPDAENAGEVMGLGPRPFRGAINLREGIKERFFSSRIFSRFAPAHALTAVREPAEPSFIEALLREVSSEAKRRWHVTASPKVERAFVLHGKGVLQVRLGNRLLAVKFPIIRWAEGFMEHEEEILKALGKRFLLKEIKAPEFYWGGVLEGRRYAVLEGFPAVSVDQPTPVLRPVIAQATGYLIQFQKMTCERRTVDEALYQQLFAKPFQALYPALGERASGLKRIEDAVHKIVLGQRIPLVWEHGDFYYENFLVDPKTRRLAAIVDWEMSNEKGLPLLDLYYSAARAGELFYGKTFEDMIIGEFMPQQYSGPMKRDFDVYLNLLKIPAEVMPALCVMAWVCRLVRSGGVRHDPKWLAGFDQVLNAVKSILKGNA